jgi:hypothetical protein
MRVFHRTPHADLIDRKGLRDGEGTYLSPEEFLGVWVSDSPLDANEGVIGEGLLALDIPESLFVQYEWVEGGKPYREALIPADELNMHLATLRSGPS